MPSSLLPKNTWNLPIQPPPISDHPQKVQKLIHRLRTPPLVQQWIRTLRYNTKETMRTLDQVVKHNGAHCLEAALSAATILEYHGYPPLIMDLESADFLDHTLFLYRYRGQYGTVGMSRDVGLYGRRPIFRNLQDLVKSYAAPYIDAKAQITGYGVLDLRKLSKSHWRTSQKNVWYVEDALNANHHRPFHFSHHFTSRWRQQYIKWHQKHPLAQPSFYPNQHQWM